MADTPVPTNPIINLADAVEKALILSLGANGVIAYFTALAPFLGWPVISTLFSAVVNAFANQFYSAIEKPIAALIIDAQTGAELSSYTKAKNALNDAQAKGDPSAINQATQDFKSALGNLVHWDGA